jgi:hypothetical protein
VAQGVQKVTNLKTARQKRDISKRYELDHIDQILLEQLVRFPSTSLRELSSLSGLSISGARKRTLAPAFRKALADASGVSSGRLAALSAIALTRLEKLVKSEDERVALSAISLIFDAVVKFRDSDDTDPKTVVYRTTISDDGRLLQDVIRGLDAEVNAS